MDLHDNVLGDRCICEKTQKPIFLFWPKVFSIIYHSNYVTGCGDIRRNMHKINGGGQNEKKL